MGGSHLIDHFANQVPIFPGEFLPGYIARLRSTAACIEPKRLMSFSGSVQLGKLHQLFPRVVSCFAYRASVRDQSGAMLAEHGNARYWRGFIDEQAYRHHIEHISSRTKSKRSMFVGEDLLQSLKPLSFCSQCREVDKERYGIGIWRAVHQIPNVYLCPVHNTPLRHFTIPIAKSLLDFPIINDEAVTGSKAYDLTEMHHWLNRTALRFVDTPSAVNRKWILDLRADVTSAKGGSECNGRVTLSSKAFDEWRVYMRQALSQLCVENDDYCAVAIKKELSIGQLLSQNNHSVHPLLFMLMLKFAEDMSSFSLQ